jgi:MFS family permease
MNLEEEEKKWWWRGLAVGFVPVAALAVAQVVSGGSPSSTLLGLAGRNAERLGESVIIVHGERVLRAYGTFAHPNVLAAWCTGLALLGLRTPERWGRVLVAAAVLMVLATGSRAGVAALLLVLISHYWPRQVWRWAGVTVIALWVAVFLAPSTLAALRGGGQLEQRSIAERQEQTREALSLLTHPRIALLGTGVGQSTLVQEQYNPGRPTYAYQPVHNTLLLLLVELGIPLTLLLAYLAYQERQRLPATIAVLAPFFAVDHLLWTSAVGPLIIALISTLDERLLSGKITKQ